MGVLFWVSLCIFVVPSVIVLVWRKPIMEWINRWKRPPVWVVSGGGLAFLLGALVAIFTMGNKGAQGPAVFLAIFAGGLVGAALGSDRTWEQK